MRVDRAQFKSVVRPRLEGNAVIDIQDSWR